MISLIRYARHRYFCKRHGWGPTWVSWLWLDAVLFAFARFWTLHSPFFNLWCGKIDRIFIERYDFTFSLTKNSGRDSWVDMYWGGCSPEDAVDNEVDSWDGDGDGEE